MSSEILLETERLRLRQLNTHDIEDLVTLNSDPQVMEYIHPGSTSSVEQESKAVDRIRELCRDKPGFGVWAIETRADNEFIGLALLKELYDTGENEVGYRLIPSAWGRGYATEISRALVQHGFDTLGLDLIVGITFPGNEASRRVLEKSGLKYAGERTYEQCKSIVPELSYFRIERPQFDLFYGRIANRKVFAP